MKLEQTVEELKKDRGSPKVGESNVKPEYVYKVPTPGTSTEVPEHENASAGCCAKTTTPMRGLTMHRSILNSGDSLPAWNRDHVAARGVREDGCDS